jgi:hypothetical protein
VKLVCYGFFNYLTDSRLHIVNLNCVISFAYVNYIVKLNCAISFCLIENFNCYIFFPFF